MLKVDVQVLGRFFGKFVGKPEAEAPNWVYLGRICPKHTQFGQIFILFLLKKIVILMDGMIILAFV